MRKIAILLATFTMTTVFSNEHLNFTPQLLIESEFSQDINEDLKAGSSALAKMEAGFELVFKEKLAAVTSVEADVESENINVQLNEAFIDYSPKDIVNFSIGQFVNSFGILESEALSDPLIKDYVETKAPGCQMNLGNDKLFGSLSIYQGMITENFKTFVPAFGINLNDKFVSKLSARIEIDHDKTYSDLSFGMGIFPIELIAFQSELYVELVKKELDEEESKILGYYADLAFFPLEKLSLAVQCNHLICNISDHHSERDMLLFDASIGYSIFDPFSLTLAFTAEGENVSNEYEWSSAVTLNATVEF